MALVEFRLSNYSVIINEWYHEFLSTFKSDKIPWSENAYVPEHDTYRQFVYPFIHYKLTQSYNVKIALTDVRKDGITSDFILILNEDDYIKLSLIIDCRTPK